MRIFIAVELSQELREKVGKLQERLEMLDIETNIVKPENLHYTLKFLGEINPEDIEKVKAVLDKLAPIYQNFDLHVAGVGAFPRPTYARVVWLGSREGGQTLKAVAESIEMALGDLGFRREERPFEPHLTIARIKSGQHKPELITLLKGLENTEIGTMKVAEIVIFSSQLTRGGAIYTPVYKVNLP